MPGSLGHYVPYVHSRMDVCTYLHTLLEVVTRWALQVACEVGNATMTCPWHYTSPALAATRQHSMSYLWQEPPRGRRFLGAYDWA